MEQHCYFRSLTALRVILTRNSQSSYPASAVLHAHLQQQSARHHPRPSCMQWRNFTAATCLGRDHHAVKSAGSSRERGNSRDADADAEDALAQGKGKQLRAPWHRDESSVPPVAQQPSAGAMKKGKLLTTPSRLLKLIIPLATLEQNADSKDIQPLALLVHPHQPLSYLERLIQSELPTIKTQSGDEKIPAVHFKAEDSHQDETIPNIRTPGEEAHRGETNAEHPGSLDETRIGNKTERTGKLSGHSVELDDAYKLGEGGVESYSGLGHENPTLRGQSRKFVRWSSSTEIGDFIRDAARGTEFIIEIEGADREIRVDVPSFNDRTHYLRANLRKLASQILTMAEVKRECDIAAHKGAQRVAMAGAGLLVGYWYVVYRLTFETELGWDTMEPVTYLVGLSTLICGYLWFLYHNREVSYRSALNLTISRRQKKLYQARGFDLQKWEGLVEEGNALRKEIRNIAREYDVDWDETLDEKHEKVKEVLKEVREQKKSEKGGKGKKEDDDDDD